MSDPITDVAVRMYRLGTGDCFVLKFLSADKVVYKALIDCGCWRRKFDDIKPFVEKLKSDVDNEVDLLVVTHEHLDHVLGFQAAKKLFTTEFKAKKVWMAWTEEDGDPTVENWKTDYGQKKFALARMAEKLKEVVASPDFEPQFAGSRGGKAMLGMRKNFSRELLRFSDLHVGGKLAAYKGSLKGMAVVKDDIAKDPVEFLKPGKLIEGLAGLDGVRIYVLGPPLDYLDVKKEHGKEGESYTHNKNLEDTDLFVHAARRFGGPLSLDGEDGEVPTKPAPAFHPSYAARGFPQTQQEYELQESAWRRIDHDWLFSSGQFALRMNSLTNNLSLVLAIEIVDSGKVLLFPGDAEFGSWKSWQSLSWTIDGKKVTTEDLLNRTVFYKVAHHLSHNGTAKSVGLDQMTHPDLVAMATLDYGVISKGWKSTMPNRQLLRQLLEQTKGRTLITSLDDLYYDLDDKVPLDEKIEEFRGKMSQAERADFDQRLTPKAKYIEYKVPVR